MYILEGVCLTFVTDRTDNDIVTCSEILHDHPAELPDFVFLSESDMLVCYIGSYSFHAVKKVTVQPYRAAYELTVPLQFSDVFVVLCY